MSEIVQATQDTMDRVIQALSSTRVAARDERELQAGLGTLLTSAGIAYRAEHRLASGDRVDFFTPDGLAIELKVKGSWSDVLRQLSRYAQDAAVTSVLLVTTRRQHRTMPDHLNGKSIRVLLLPGAFA